MEHVRRIKRAVVALVTVITAGTLGYIVLGFTPLEAVYQTVTTVATVGFREVRPLTAAGQVYTILLILVGVGTVLYNLGVILEAVTEGHLRTYLEGRRMDRRIETLSGHVIVCGYGRVGGAGGPGGGGGGGGRGGAGGGGGAPPPPHDSRGPTSTTCAATSPTTPCCAARESTGPAR